MDKNNYNYNVDDVEDFGDFVEYFGLGIDDDDEDDGEPKELNFG